MRISLAWNNTLQNKKRALAAIGGITFSILLIFMQLGFLQTARINSTTIYNYFDFDLIITSSRYEALDQAGVFDQARLLQARVVPGVAEVSQITFTRTRWRDPANNNLRSSCLALGFDLNPAFIPERDRALLQAIQLRDMVLLNLYSHPDYGEKRVGKGATIENRPVTIGGVFAMGAAFQAEGACILSLETYQSITRGDSRQVSFGLVKAAPGVTPEELKKRLKASLPNDVFVFQKSELIKRESDYYINVKPVGIMFKTGAFVALCVGAVILYQVLSTEITNKLREFATLKAIGFTVRYVYGVGIQQALIYAALSYVPAFLLSLVVFHAAYKLSNLPVVMTPNLALIVLGLSLLMTSISSTLALQKVRRADPADLF